MKEKIEEEQRQLQARLNKYEDEFDKQFDEDNE